MSEHRIHTVLLTFSRHSKLFSKLPCDLSYFCTLFFCLEFELSAHLIHRISDDSVFDKATFFVLSHFFNLINCKLIVIVLILIAEVMK